MVTEALNSLLNDSGFQLPGPHTIAALESASILLSWSEEHESHFNSFATELVASLQTCFLPSTKSSKWRKEKMWGMYHTTRTSGDFKVLWTEFLNRSISHTPSPTFYQYVTDHLFKKLITINFPTDEQSSGKKTISLTFEERNALRFVAGYVCRKVRNKLELSSYKEKNDMILFLIEVSGDQQDSDEEGPEAWTNLIDRGGLWHTHDSMYVLFHSMEEVICRHLTPPSVSQQVVGSRKKLTKATMTDKDFLFEWCVFSGSTDDTIARPVLQLIVELYVTVLGFAFVSFCLEFYKQANRKGTQKSKGIRKEVFTTKIT